MTEKEINEKIKKLEEEIKELKEEKKKLKGQYELVTEWTSYDKFKRRKVSHHKTLQRAMETKRQRINEFKWRTTMYHEKITMVKITLNGELILALSSF